MKTMIAKPLIISTLFASVIAFTIPNAFASSTPFQTTHYIDVMGKEQFSLLQNMDMNYHQYPNHPSMMKIGSSFDDSKQTLTPLDNKFRYTAKVLDMVETPDFNININKEIANQVNKHQIYREQYPYAGAVAGGLTGATIATIQDKNDEKSNRQAAIASGLGFLIGKTIGEHQYQKKYISHGFKPIETYIVVFELDSGETGSFVQTAENLRIHNVKIGSKIQFSKNNHIWKFEHF